MLKKLISVIIPIYNEEVNIPIIHKELENVFADLKNKYNYEIIFVDDGSNDKSLEILEKLVKRHRNSKFIQFSRNFGKEIALSAGLQISAGDAVVTLDADLQHPPKILPKFLEKWENGAEVVVGIRKKYKVHNKFRKFFSYIFYKVQNSISKVKISSSETDFRLLDRKVVNEFNKFTERNRITRGLIDWLGYPTDYVYFEIKNKNLKKGGYNTLKLFKLAFSTFISLSLFPLKFAGYLGLIITILSGLLGIIVIIDKYLLRDVLGWNVSGTSSLALLIIFMVGINLCCLGLISLYIANIQDEVTNRPLFVIRKTGNINI